MSRGTIKMKAFDSPCCFRETSYLTTAMRESLVPSDSSKPSTIVSPVSTLKSMSH